MFSDRREGALSWQQVGRALYLPQEFMGFAEGSGLLWLAGMANGVRFFAPLYWTITRLKECAPERAIMVEVTSEANAYGAVEAMADVIQLEKFEPNTVASDPGASETAPKLAAFTIPLGVIDGTAQLDWTICTTALERGCADPGLTMKTKEPLVTGGRTVDPVGPN